MSIKSDYICNVKTTMVKTKFDKLLDKYITIYQIVISDSYGNILGTHKIQTQKDFPDSPETISYDNNFNEIITDIFMLGYKAKVSIDLEQCDIKILQYLIDEKTDFYKMKLEQNDWLDGDSHNRELMDNIHRLESLDEKLNSNVGNSK